MIRPVTPEEAENAALIYALCAQDMNDHGFYNWGPGYPSIREALRDAQAGTLYGYYYHGALCGLVTYDRTEVPQYESVPFRYPPSQSLMTHRLAVSPAHQQHGISKELLRFGLQLTADLGLQALHIDCLSINPGPMHLFRRMGFHHVGEIYYPEKDPRVRDYPFYCFEKIIGQ